MNDKSELETLIKPRDNRLVRERLQVLHQLAVVPPVRLFPTKHCDPWQRSGQPLWGSMLRSPPTRPDWAWRTRWNRVGC